MKLLVVDIETTGFFVNTDAIVEIGIVLVDTETKEIEIVFDNVVKHKNFNINKHKNSWIFENTTLTVDDVINANTLDNYHDEIQGLFDKYKMTAYNKAFDVRFLSAAGFKMKEVKCLMHTATQYSTYKDKNGKPKKPSVEEIYNQFFMKDGEIYVEEHRAGADAKDEAKILLHMVDLKNDKTLISNHTTKIKNTTKTNKKSNTSGFKALGLDDKFPFGKYKGKLVSEILISDKRYIRWCIKEIKDFSLTSEVNEILLSKN